MRSALLLAIAVALALLAGCAASEPRKVEATPYTAEPGPEVKPWAALVACECPCDPELPRGPGGAVALVRAESSMLIDPGPADIEAVSLAAGWEHTTPVVHGSSRCIERVDLCDLRAKAGSLRAALLLVARFDGRGRDRVLLATLHDVRTGRELSRYGPGEPSLTLAAHHLAKALH